MDLDYLMKRWNQMRAKLVIENNCLYENLDVTAAVLTLTAEVVDVLERIKDKMERI